MSWLFGPLCIQRDILVHRVAEIERGIKTIVFIPASEGVAVTRRITWSVNNGTLDNDLIDILCLIIHFAAVERIGYYRPALHCDVLSVIVVKAAAGTQRVLGTVFGHKQ